MTAASKWGIRLGRTSQCIGVDCIVFTGECVAVCKIQRMGADLENLFL